MCVCVCVYVCVCLCTLAHKGPEYLIPRRWTKVVSHLMWVLGTQLKSSASTFAL